MRVFGHVERLGPFVPQTGAVKHQRSDRADENRDGELEDQIPRSEGEGRRGGCGEDQEGGASEPREVARRSREAVIRADVAKVGVEASAQGSSTGNFQCLRPSSWGAADGTDRRKQLGGGEPEGSSTLGRGVFFWHFGVQVSSIGKSAKITPRPPKAGGSPGLSQVDPAPPADYILKSPMANLDDELRDALASSDRSADASAEARSTVPSEEAPAVLKSPVEEPPKRNLGLLAGLLVVMGGLLTLVFTSVDDAAIYSVTTDKLVKNKSEYEDRNVRVEGDLVNGTLRFRKEPCEYRFSMEKNGEKIAVRYPACVVPDTFKDVPGVEVQVTAEGKLSPEGHFEATHIMAKCPSKYEMEQRAKNGEQAPHDLMGTVPSVDADPSPEGPAIEGPALPAPALKAAEY